MGGDEGGDGEAEGGREEEGWEGEVRGGMVEGREGGGREEGRGVVFFGSSEMKKSLCCSFLVLICVIVSILMN